MNDARLSGSGCRAGQGGEGRKGKDLKKKESYKGLQEATAAPSTAFLQLGRVTFDS